MINQEYLNKLMFELKKFDSLKRKDGSLMLPRVVAARRRSIQKLLAEDK